MCLEFYSHAPSQTLRAAHIHLKLMKRPLTVLFVQELGAWNKIRLYCRPLGPSQK